MCHKPAGIAVAECQTGSRGYGEQPEELPGTQKSRKNAVSWCCTQAGSAGRRRSCVCKTPKAASGLTRQITSKTVTKEYLAVTAQMSDEKQGHLEDYLKKDSRTNSSSVVASKTPGAKKAVLDYWVQEEIKDERTETGKRILVKIALDTGRHHQIRVQMAHKGMPLLGDRKYNAKDLSGLPLGLCSCHLAFRHPVTGKKMEFKAAPKGEAFTGFQTL